MSVTFKINSAIKYTVSRERHSTSKHFIRMRPALIKLSSYRHRLTSIQRKSNRAKAINTPLINALRPNRTNIRTLVARGTLAREPIGRMHLRLIHCANYAKNASRITDARVFPPQVSVAPPRDRLDDRSIRVLGILERCSPGRNQRIEGDTKPR